MIKKEQFKELFKRESIIDNREKKIKSDLRSNLLEIKNLLELSSTVIWEVDKNGLYTHISSQSKELLGYSPDEIIGKKYLYEIFQKDMKEKDREYIISIINRNDILKGIESKLKTKNNKDLWILTSGFPIFDNEGRLLYFRGISIDITHIKEAEEEIKFLNSYDKLTGLYNRDFFEGKLDKLDKEINLPISLIMMDVDGLKLVNDAFGHKSGDLLLRKVANIIKQECRIDDIVSRIGGDEFVMLLPKTSLEKAKGIIKRINKKIKQKKIEAINISVSYGCATKKIERKILEKF